MLHHIHVLDSPADDRHVERSVEFFATDANKTALLVVLPLVVSKAPASFPLERLMRVLAHRLPLSAAYPLLRALLFNFPDKCDDLAQILIAQVALSAPKGPLLVTRLLLDLLRLSPERAVRLRSVLVDHGALPELQVLPSLLFFLFLVLLIS